MGRKMVPLHRSKPEYRLWKAAEEKARGQMGESAREGEVLAYICAEFVGKEPPIFEELEA